MPTSCPFDPLSQTVGRIRSSLDTTMQKSFRSPAVALWCAAFALLPGAPAFAGGALLVDDASITPAHSCQLEGWVRHSDAGEELTAVPACNWSGTEFSMGAGRFLRRGGVSPLSAGAKHVWQDGGSETVGVATSLGVSWNNPGVSRAVWTVNLPVTLSFGSSGQILLHANAGWVAGRANGPTAGLGLEKQLTESFKLLAEAYAQHDHFRAYQAGLRIAPDDSWSIDLLAGYLDAASHGGSSVVIGINMPFSRLSLTP